MYVKHLAMQWPPLSDLAGFMPWIFINCESLLLQDFIASAHVVFVIHTAVLLINYTASCLTLIVVVREHNKGLPNMAMLPKSKDYKSPKGIPWLYLR